MAIVPESLLLITIDRDNQIPGASGSFLRTNIRRLTWIMRLAVIAQPPMLDVQRLTG